MRVRASLRLTDDGAEYHRLVLRPGGVRTLPTTGCYSMASPGTMCSPTDAIYGESRDDAARPLTRTDAVGASVAAGGRPFGL